MPSKSAERRTHLQVVASQSARSTTEERILPALELAFAPLHKAAFGVATGVAGALAMVMITGFVLLVPRAQGFPLELLATYFTGYSVSWGGVLVGGGWGFLVCFVAGWFVAFCRNMALAITAFSIRTRAELQETREFLDHI
ncbi:MAG: hypothetical protein IPF47_25790 [Gemmatimonadetes bacterium]|nr:hypothetical protein [Gemmatimonadota bacterium]MBK6843452.1 hypothetical protein [Gemmatimonadota bacterium]